MATLAENERLAVLESQYVMLQRDVTEIKADVKALVSTQAMLATALAAKEAAQLAGSHERETTGVWVRSLLPLLFALLAVGISFYNAIVLHP
jgi:hypothetical protein